MRQLVLITVFLTASACTGCASLGFSRDSDACLAAQQGTLGDRIADPCGYADLLARCAGLPEPERTRIAIRCRDEQAVVQLRAAECTTTTEK